MSTDPPRPPGPDATATTPAAPRRRRRRRRGQAGPGAREHEGPTGGVGGGRAGERQGGRGARPRRPEDALPRKPESAPPLVPTVSRLAASAATPEPLTPAEVTEMKRHLAFIRSYKEALRLKLNAAEDLLVNGQREPSDRGVCKHLLGKIDRTVVEGAIGREPLRSNPAARARMLEGAIRLTADPSVLLTYLETLTHVRSHTEAAQAFGEVAARLDFESMSASRLGRLLQVLVETFSGHERVQVLFSLLAAPPFARAFDAALASLPPAVVDAIAPLRAVHRRAHAIRASTSEGPATVAASSTPPTADLADDPPLLRAGVEQLVSAPDPVLRGYAEPLRIAILELVLADVAPPEIADRAAGVLLSSLPRADRTYARLAVRHAAQLLGRHADDRARAILEELRRAQPGFRLAERWLSALDGRRVGRVALRAAIADGIRLTPGFWLDGQREVWVRTAPVTGAERVGREAALQRELVLPGIAPVVEDGVAGGIPYVAVAGAGRPLVAAPDELPLAAALTVGAAAIRILHALARAEVMLPDAAPDRFLYTPPPVITLVLADLDGAAAASTADAAAAHLVHARDLLRRLLSERALRRLPSRGVELVTTAATLAELARIFDDLALRAPRD